LGRDTGALRRFGFSRLDFGEGPFQSLALKLPLSISHRAVVRPRDVLDPLLAYIDEGVREPLANMRASRLGDAQAARFRKRL
jgi:hypothetical protein